MENLLKIGQLKGHPPDAQEIQRLLAAARRNLADARVTAISPAERNRSVHNGTGEPV